jgi:hypothetical protein
VVASAAARSLGAGSLAPAALTAGFRAGFAVGAALAVAGAATAAVLLRDEGRGERSNLIELQASR